MAGSNEISCNKGEDIMPRKQIDRQTAARVIGTHDIVIIEEA